MARACGTAAITYGVDCQGVSKAMLQKMRTTIAAAASTGAGGKNKDKILHMCDGLSGTLDPANDGLTLGLLRWTTAWWEQWTAREDMKRAYEGACEKCCRTGYRWRNVAGPAAALAVALVEIGWDWIAADKFKDDSGREWSASLDPPVCIAKAAKRSVRRWRKQKITKTLPGLMPVYNDSADKWMTGRSVVLDVSHVTSRIACGKVDKLPQAPEFTRKCAPSLLSAVTGGQWTQCRRAAVPSYGITDNQCQLCLNATGTMVHRWDCKCTKPENGWTQPAKGADRAAQVVGEKRVRLLEDHGMLLLRVPARPLVKYDSFQWLSQPPPDEVDGLSWYIDGSAQNPKWEQIATYGFGIVVVNANGDLVAWGYGIPPEWITSAADAEAWALKTAVGDNVCVPKIVTDCKSLLAISRRGASRACTASMPLARTWAQIVNSLDGAMDDLCNNLVWMPSHTTASNFRAKRKSNGGASLQWTGEPTDWPTSWRSWAPAMARPAKRQLN